jgi:integrase
MTLYKRGGVWWTEFVFKGQRIRKPTGTPSKTQAAAFEDKLRRDLHDQHILGRTREMTFGEAADNYTRTNIMARRKGDDGADSHAAKAELGRIRKIEEFFGSTTALTLVAAPARIAEFRQDLLKTVKPNSANRTLNVLRAILNRAFKDGGLLKPPLVESFKVNDARDYFLTEEEEERLLGVSPEHLRRIVTFILDTGARKDEAMKLTWDRVSLPEDGRGSVRFVKTKTDKPRTVPLPKRTADMLAGMRPAEVKKGQRVFLWTPLGKDKEEAFNNPRTAWATARKAAKLGGLRIHDLRHTYASKLIRKRVPLYEVSKLLGHSSIRMTERYAHLVQDQLDQAVSALD